MKHRSGYTTVELMLACALLALMIGLVVIPAYTEYRHGREVDDAATLLAADIAYLERYAENSDPYEGATIEVESGDPLRYTCYSGRPTSLDPQSHIRAVLFVRSYQETAIAGGPLSRNTPLLFAHNGSVQYIDGGQWADQHTAVTFMLRSLSERGRTAEVTLDPFTGAASAL